MFFILCPIRIGQEKEEEEKSYGKIFPLELNDLKKMFFGPAYDQLQQQQQEEQQQQKCFTTVAATAA